MIPQFPQFKTLSLEDRQEVEARTHSFPSYSDFNFTSLWCWDINHKREISLLNDNLVVKFTDYETDEFFLSYLGTKDTEQTALTLLAYSESIGLPASLRLVPEISVHDIVHNELAIRTDSENFDYIYLTSRMATLHGNQYKSKRRAAESFAKTRPNHTFEMLPLSEPATQEAVRTIAASWRNHKNVSADDQSILHEVEAIENVFLLAREKDDLLAGLVRVDGIASAFTIEEIINGAVSIGHFWKTSEQSMGEYEYLASETASYLADQGVTYWNWEQDLGIENLRASKSSYRPSDFLKKYTINKQMLS